MFFRKNQSASRPLFHVYQSAGRIEYNKIKVTSNLQPPTNKVQFEKTKIFVVCTEKPLCVNDRKINFENCSLKCFFFTTERELRWNEDERLRPASYHPSTHIRIYVREYTIWTRRRLCAEKGFLLYLSVCVEDKAEDAKIPQKRQKALLISRNVCDEAKTLRYIRTRSSKCGANFKCYLFKKKPNFPIKLF